MDAYCGEKGRREIEGGRVVVRVRACGSHTPINVGFDFSCLCFFISPRVSG